MSKINLRLAWLYSKTMNLYGDRGNILVLKKRAEWRGIGFDVIPMEIGDKFISDEFDMAFFGGGQDKEQFEVAKDLQTKKEELIKFFNQRKVMLAVCGGYQLLGKYFKTKNKEKIDGIGIFDVYTIGSDKRMIGDVKLNCGWLGEKVVGFENHSGKTYFGERKTNNDQKEFGKVVSGYGNNAEDKTEGVKCNNFIGTYLHGPILPKNPKLADWMVETALEIKYKDKIKLKKTNDDLENKARKFVIDNK